MVDLSIDTSQISGGDSTIDRSDFLTPFGDVETHLENILNGVQAFDTLLLNATLEPVTIDAGGAATITRSLAEINANSGTTDDLDTITLSAGVPCFIKAAAGDTITIRDNSASGGNIYTVSGDNIVLSGEKVLQVMAVGSNVAVIGDGGSGGGGAGAPVGAQYVTLAADATLTDERVLTPGNELVLTDGGAGGNATLDVNIGSATNKVLASDVLAAGNDRNLIVQAESGVADDLIEVTGLSVGERVYLHASAGDTITVKHNDAGATNKIHLNGNTDAILDEQNPLVLVQVATNVLAQLAQTALMVTAQDGYLPGSEYSTTSGTFVDVDATNVKLDMTLIGGGSVLVLWHFSAFKDTAGTAQFRITDGTNNSPTYYVTNSHGEMLVTLFHVFTGLSAGSTTFKLQYRTSDANTARIRQSILNVIGIEWGAP